ncbi:DUF4263 domain-containing protein [Hassallia byssoidea VB512170]|uniref:DUF4263 domain-containing protein n=1 Tax=Hassallia byssoidea VB512170 TaxID=1304833 RepID=A0A846H8A0_9CYAN|nr:DUF4263 domain-containing protein [Hassalia byssoidea VB512170]
MFSQIVDFLPEKTELMVLVKPSEDVDEELKRLTVREIKVQPKKAGVYVPISLDELLKIKFSISKAGKLSRDLERCKFSTPVLPNEQLKSLNQTYQEISRLFEKNRLAPGGKVYDNIYFKDKDDCWKLLEILRDRIYQPFEDEFEKQQRIINEKDDVYVRPLVESENLFFLELEQKDKRIDVLQSQNKNLQEQSQEFKTKYEKSKLFAYQQKLDEFKNRLKSDYPETSGTDSWQEWIYKNNWLFGIQYGSSIAHPQVGFRSILDYLFPTPDGFIDILEIKKPSHDVIKEDKSHPGAFKWSSEVNEAIGQVVNYLHEIELHQLEIAKKLKQELSLELSAIKPRAFILIGRSDDWNEKHKEAFRRLNHSLHGIEILTYTDLLQRGENLMKVYAD